MKFSVLELEKRHEEKTKINEDQIEILRHRLNIIEQRQCQIKDEHPKEMINQKMQFQILIKEFEERYDQYI